MVEDRCLRPLNQSLFKTTKTDTLKIVFIDLKKKISERLCKIKKIRLVQFSQTSIFEN